MSGQGYPAWGLVCAAVLGFVPCLPSLMDPTIVLEALEAMEVFPLAAASFLARDRRLDVNQSRGPMRGVYHKGPNYGCPLKWE